MLWSYQSAEVAEPPTEIATVKPTSQKLYEIFSEYAEALCKCGVKKQRDPFPVKIEEEEKGEEGSKESEHVEEKPEPKHLNLYKHRIDKNSFKILFATVPLSQLDTLKFSNNGLKRSQLQILVDAILDDSCKIQHLYLDWNPIYKEEAQNFEKQNLEDTNEENPSLYSQLLKSKSLRSLYLRSDNLKTHDMAGISKELADNKVLKVLDLSDNKLRNKDLKQICEGLETNRTLQFLGLSKNKITSVNALSEKIGKMPFPAGEVDAHMKKVKERDQIIEKNKKKKKGQPEDPVPVVDEIQEDPDSAGEWSIIKNTQYLQLNLSLNRISDAQIGNLQQFIKGIHDGLEVSLSGNKLSEESLVKLKQEFPTRVR